LNEPTASSRVLGGAEGLDLIERLEALHVAVISDCLDQIGFRHNVMQPSIRPLVPGSRTAGFALTVELVAVDAPPPDPRDYYKGEIEALETMQRGDVMVVSTCPGSYWGELLATASRLRGARGVVADAFTRDTTALIEMDFPTFVAGISPQDSLGRTDVASFGGTIECGGVAVSRGDLVLADNDGVAVIPAAHAWEVIDRAEAKVATESEMRGKLRDGMPLSEAFTTYGVL
jgi:4-hydroxy-4-methyl-2-oxoglutarate aldolase